MPGIYCSSPTSNPMLIQSWKLRSPPIYLLFNNRGRVVYWKQLKLIGWAKCMAKNFFSHQKVLHQLHTPHSLGPIYMTYGYIASVYCIVTFSLSGLPSSSFLIAFRMQKTGWWEGVGTGYILRTFSGRFQGFLPQNHNRSHSTCCC